MSDVDLSEAWVERRIKNPRTGESKVVRIRLVDLPPAEREAVIQQARPGSGELVPRRQAPRVETWNP